jgi:type II secretory pathway pseudopilin PulG
MNTITLRHNAASQRKCVVAAGYTLVEVLTMITIISLLTAFALPRIGSLNGSASEASNQNNAQNIISMYTAGRDGGFVKWNKTSRNACIAEVIAGKPADPASMFKGVVFRVSNIRGSALTGIYQYIGIDAKGDLFYDKTGSQSGVTTIPTVTLVSGNP